MTNKMSIIVHLIGATTPPLWLTTIKSPTSSHCVGTRKPKKIDMTNIQI